MCARSQNNAGFTLVELMVTLAVAAALMMFAAPSFSDAMANSRRSVAINDVVGALQLARSEAIKSTFPVSVCARASDTACGTDWSNGILVHEDNGATAGTVEGGEAILRIITPFDRVTVDNIARISSGAGTPVARSFVRFGPRGTSNWRGGGTFSVCDDRGTEHAAAINVLLSGVIQQARKNADGTLVNSFGNEVGC